MNCTRLCNNKDKTTCEYCKKKYIVSNYFYKAQRPVDNTIVKGYLVQDKETGKVLGILNSSNEFNELAFIKENTLEVIKDRKVPIYRYGYAPLSR